MPRCIRLILLPIPPYTFTHVYELPARRGALHVRLACVTTRDDFFLPRQPAFYCTCGSDKIAKLDGRCAQVDLWESARAS